MMGHTNTGKKGRNLAVTFLLMAAAFGCSDPPPAADGGTARGFLQILNSGGQDVGLRPNKEATLRVRYTDRLGTPFAHAKIQFAIYGDPKGSSLSLGATATDDSGEASVTVRAGASAATFSVRVTAPQDVVTFYMEVTNAELSALSIHSKYAGSLPLLSLVKVTYFLTHEVKCATFDPLKPPGDARERTAPMVGQTVTFKAVPMNLDHAVLGRARDGKGVVRATGCVDVPRAVLKSDQTVRVWLSLADLLPRVAGTYSLITNITIPKGGAKAASWPRPVADALEPNDSQGEAQILTQTSFAADSGSLYNGSYAWGWLESEVDQDWYVFQGEKGWYLTVYSTASWYGSLLDPVFEVYDAGGELLGSYEGDSDDSGPDFENLGPLEEGSHYLRIVHPEGTKEGGPGHFYSFALYVTDFEVTN